MRLFLGIITMIFLTASLAAAADDSFDGTKTLLCSSIQAIDCTRGDECVDGMPEDMGAPQFMRIDFAKKEIRSTKRTTTISQMDKNENQLTLQGFEIGMGWTIAIDRSTGKMTVALAGSEQAYVIFGACTAL